MATVGDIIDRSLRSLKAIDANETLDTQVYTDHIETLNGMLHSWHRFPFRTQVSQALTADTASFTIGSGADVDTTRPQEITSMYLRDSANNDFPVAIRNLDEYTDVTLKTTQGLPELCYIRKGYPNWTVYFEFSTDQAYTLYMELIQPLTSFTASTDTFNLPLEFEDAVVYNLAVRLQPEYPLTNSFQIIAGLARDSLKKVKTLTSQPVKITKMNVPGRYRKSNIYSGE